MSMLNINRVNYTLIVFTFVYVSVLTYIYVHSCGVIMLNHIPIMYNIEYPLFVL